MKKPILVLTPGDPDGVGPEITWKVIKSGKFNNIGILCVGAKAPFKKLRAPVVEFDPLTESLVPPHRKGPFVWLMPAPEIAPPGAFLEGFQAGWSIEQAARLVLNGAAAALVTGPIHKDRLQRGGYLFAGHTEFLAALCETKDVTMMLINDALRISLVTIHLSLRDVPQAISREKIRRAVTQTAEGLRSFWGIRRPRIAVAALNPHGGESGLFGREEVDLIEPEIHSLQQKGGNHFEVFGPFPSDTLFAKHVLATPKRRFDAIVAMYHDQGLIPVKLLDFHKTVNVTLGLPMIRTSVDHGVGFDIAGQGIANPSSLHAAIELAISMVKTVQTAKAKPNKRG